MQVGAFRQSRIADLPDLLAALHLLPRHHFDFAQVGVTGFVAESVVQQDLTPVSPRPFVVEGDESVPGGINRRSDVRSQVDALVSFHPSCDRVYPRAERADVAAQFPAVERPDRGNRFGHQRFVFGQHLEFVERFGLQVQHPGHCVEVSPRADHLRRVHVSFQEAVFRVGIGRIDSVQVQRVGGEQRAVHVVVAVTQFLQFGGRRADFVVQDVVLQHQFVVPFADAVHLRRVEEKGEEQVDHRSQDKADQHLPQNPIEPDAERDRHHLVGQGLWIEFIPLFCHAFDDRSDIGRLSSGCRRKFGH